MEGNVIPAVVGEQTYCCEKSCITDILKMEDTCVSVLIIQSFTSLVM